MQLYFPFSKPKEKLLEDALQNNRGTAPWKAWKAESAKEVVALANDAPRLTLLELDLSADFQLAYSIRMPAPVKLGDSGLQVANGVIFLLRFQDEWRFECPPPYGVLAVAHPQGVLHPNLRNNGPISGLCVGDIPAGIKPSEIVLLGYSALSLQTLTLDETDVNGVLTPEACELYRTRFSDYVPLTRAGLLEPWERWEGFVNA